MQSVLDAETVLVQIQEQAEKIKSDATQYFPEAASPGDCWRQGDIYITLMEKMPPYAYETYKPRKQLVPGTTRGSRHCLDSLNGVRVYYLNEPELTSNSFLNGPVIECKKERTITHPEHGNVVLPPGIYAISYQRSLNARGQERMVLD